MKPHVLSILLVLMTSCDFFVSKEKKTQEIVAEKLKGIDWNDIDSYPLFENCDELVSKNVQRECFESELLKHCSQSLKDFNFSFDALDNNIIQVDFLVDKDGRISILAIDKDSTIDTQMPEFDLIISESLKSIPPLAPALKQGMPVKAKFRMPIELQAN